MGITFLEMEKWDINFWEVPSFKEGQMSIKHGVMEALQPVEL
jgi:hypothetical protein